MAISKMSIDAAFSPHKAGLCRINTSMSKMQRQIYLLRLTTKHVNKKAQCSHELHPGRRLHPQAVPGTGHTDTPSWVSFVRIGSLRSIPKANCTKECISPHLPVQRPPRRLGSEHHRCGRLTQSEPRVVVLLKGSVNVQVPDRCSRPDRGSRRGLRQASTTGRAGPARPGRRRRAPR